MTFDEWFVKYPLPAEIDTMDDTDREQWTWALRSAYKTGAASTREWVGLTLDEIDLLEELYAPPVHPDFVNDASHCLELIRHVEAKLKEKNT